MKIQGLSDAELLKRGCHWKIGTVRENGRFAYARPMALPNKLWKSVN